MQKRLFTLGHQSQAWIRADCQRGVQFEDSWAGINDLKLEGSEALGFCRHDQTARFATNACLATWNASLAIRNQHEHVNFTPELRKQRLPWTNQFNEEYSQNWGQGGWGSKAHSWSKRCLNLKTPKPTCQEHACKAAVRAERQKVTGIFFSVWRHPWTRAKHGQTGGNQPKVAGRRKHARK